MTLQIQVGSRCDQADVAEQAATGIPARVLLRHGRCLDYQFVITLLQLVGHVNLESHVAIVSTSYVLSVQIDIAYQHDALEVQQVSFIFQR